MELVSTANVTELVSGINDFNTCSILFLVAIGGAIGSMAHAFASPPENKIAVLRYIAVGAVAALAVFFAVMPKEAVRLIALSIVSGYCAKAVLNALEARVKIATKVKENGKEAVAVGKKAVNIAQSLALINGAVINIQGEPRESFLESMKTDLSVDLREFVSKPPELRADELKQLSNKLEFLGESFTK
jgi:predicted MFS family arabinose efflux permease